MDKEKLFSDLMAYKDTVFRICLGFSRDHGDAEDLAQEVYLRAYDKLESLRQPHLRKEWLYRIARNICLNQVKKRARWPISALEPGQDQAVELTPETHLDRQEQLKILKRVLARLPQKQREIFVLKEYGHLSYQQIAALLGIKEGTVMSRLNRARQAVIEKMRRQVYGKE
jgi:RNA polymerase sigma-70 factor (ECF subfamily)